MLKIEESQLERTGSAMDRAVGMLLDETTVKVTVVLGMGIVSGAMNYEHGEIAMLTAGLKQAAYSALSAHFLFGIYNKLADRVQSFPGELVPIVVPIVLSVAANLGVHCMKGTAEPVLSTLPTAIALTIGFPIWHIKTRIQQLWKDIEDIEIKL